MRPSLTASVVWSVFLYGTPFVVASPSLSPIPRCQPNMEAGEVCQIRVDALRPGQSAVGEKEVADKREKIAAMNADKFQKYMRKRMVPVVIAADGSFHMTDRHHMGAAIITAKGRQTLVLAKVSANWSGLDQNAFWQRMVAERQVYLYDENGQGPISPSQLPSSLLGMKDDPYRSLAWGVREDGGYKDLDSAYAEFAWANYFRPLIPVPMIHEHFKKAVAQGVHLAQEPEACHLPGFKGDACE